MSRYFFHKTGASKWIAKFLFSLTQQISYLLDEINSTLINSLRIKKTRGVGEWGSRGRIVSDEKLTHFLCSFGQSISYSQYSVVNIIESFSEPILPQKLPAQFFLYFLKSFLTLIFQTFVFCMLMDTPHHSITGLCQTYIAIAF